MSASNSIKHLLKVTRTTQQELADRMGVSQPAIAKKLKLNDWRESDLKTIADICGCKYGSCFILENGVEIDIE